MVDAVSLVIRDNDAPRYHRNSWPKFNCYLRSNAREHAGVMLGTTNASFFLCDGTHGDLLIVRADMSLA
jgi:hypothetical protein